MRPRRVLAGGAAAVAAAVSALAVAPSALAASTDQFTWHGAGTTQNWSDPTNWTASSGQTNLSPSGTADTLTFPALTCGASPDPCTGFDDLSSLMANELSVDTSTNYRQGEATSGGPLTLAGNGGTPNVGLTTTYTPPASGGSPTASFNLPMLLTGPAQTWNIGQGNLYVGQIGDASGQTTPLTVALGGPSPSPGVAAPYGFLQAGSITTAGPLTVTGNGDLGIPSGSGVANPTLPAVTLGGTTYLTVSTSTSSGAIDAHTDTGDVQVFGVPGSTLTVASGNLTLGPNNGLDVDIDGNGPGQSTSVNVANGSAALGGATLYVDQNFEAAAGTPCTTLTPGTTVTLLSASGGITGPVVVNGQTINPGGSATEPIVSSCPQAQATAIVNYNATTITATIAGPPVAGAPPQITGGAAVGDQLTVSNNGSWGAANPAPTYSYQWYSCAGTSCSPISGATQGSYTLTTADLGNTVEVQVTATNSQGSAVAASNQVGPVVSAPMLVAGHGPQITGHTTVGDRLTVSDNGTWIAQPAASYTYQWYSCSGPSCSTISGATGATYTLTKAQVGRMVKVLVTATNSVGSAQAASNELGPVNVAVVRTPLRVLIRRNLARLGHPHGRHAILLLARRGVFITRFHAPAGGRLSDVWTTVRRQHGKRHRLVVARARIFVRAGHTVRVVIRLTPTGRFLLRHHVGLFTIAHEGFFVRGLGWTSMVRRFRL